MKILLYFIYFYLSLFVVFFCVIVITQLINQLNILYKVGNFSYGKSDFIEAIIISNIVGFSTAFFLTILSYMEYKGQK